MIAALNSRVISFRRVFDTCHPVIGNRYAYDEEKIESYEC